jgi:hypothetical protein
MTFEAFERLPGKLELIDGEVVGWPVPEQPTPEARCTKSAHVIFRGLDRVLADAHAKGGAVDLGAVYIGAGYQVAHDTRIRLDVSITDANQAAGIFLEGAAAIAIEIISPSYTVEEMDTNTGLCFEHGTREIWRIYQRTRHVTVHTAREIRDFRENDTPTTLLLSGLALSVREILGA